MPLKTLIEILALLISVVCCGRVLFIKSVHYDSLAVMTPAAFIISILNFFAYGVSFLGIIVSVLTFFIFILNIKALRNRMNEVVIDGFGIFHTLISIINMLLALSLLFVEVWYFPLPNNLAKMKIQKTQVHLAGNFEKGFTEPSNKKIFEPKPCTVTVYQNHVKDSDEIAFNKKKSAETSEEPDDSPDVFDADGMLEKERKIPAEAEAEPKKIILFIPNECSSVYNYEAVLASMVTEGYTVYAAEIYSKDLAYFGNLNDTKPLRSFKFYTAKKFNTSKYSELLRYKKLNLSKEFEALLSYASPSEDDLVFLCSDGDCYSTLKDVQKNHKKLVDSFYDLSDIAGYNTPGLGPVEQTYPLLAKLYGFERDRSGKAAAVLTDAMKKQFSFFEK